METSQKRAVRPEGLSELLTVVEAGAALRVGRTTAYAMAREWRETGGKSGLPVIEVGHLLRVPRRALEELMDGGVASERRRPTDRAADASPAGSADRSSGAAQRRASRRPRRKTTAPTRRPPNATPNQLKLFDDATD